MLRFLRNQAAHLWSLAQRQFLGLTSGRYAAYVYSATFPWLSSVLLDALAAEKELENPLNWVERLTSSLEEDRRLGADDETTSRPSQSEETRLVARFAGREPRWQRTIEVRTRQTSAPQCIHLPQSRVQQQGDQRAGGGGRAASQK